METNPFIEKIEKIRKDARTHIEKGAITPGYSVDKKTLMALLNSALATEQICTLRYKKHYYTATKLGASIAADEFLEHSQQEAEHADKLADRIAQLDGEPEFDPEKIIEIAHVKYVNCNELSQMVKENLIAERIAIDSYREMIKFIGDDDPTTRRILEDILATEEEHADDLVDIANQYQLKLTG